MGIEAGSPARRAEYRSASLRRCDGVGHRLTASRSRLTLAGEVFVPDVSGALWWPAMQTLLVADLHLEKGSAHAARGALLPPYDTARTLACLEDALARYAPRRVVALGDSFHDSDAGARIAAPDLDRLARLQAQVDWTWIAGNHDPHPPAGVGGAWLSEAVIGPVALRHEPTYDAEAEIAGHLHPAAKLRQRGRTLRRRCLAADKRRVILPAFGAFTGGLNVLDRAFDGLLDRAGFSAWMLGASAVHAVSGRRLIP